MHTPTGPDCTLAHTGCLKTNWHAHKIVDNSINMYQNQTKPYFRSFLGFLPLGSHLGHCTWTTLGALAAAKTLEIPSSTLCSPLKPCSQNIRRPAEQSPLMAKNRRNWSRSVAADLAKICFSCGHITGGRHVVTPCFLSQPGSTVCCGDLAVT